MFPQWKYIIHKILLILAMFKGQKLPPDLNPIQVFNKRLDFHSQSFPYSIKFGALLYTKMTSFNSETLHDPLSMKELTLRYSTPFLQNVEMLKPYENRFYIYT